MKKVIIGMSGGVDSSVAAYVLKNKGYEVLGVTLSLCSKDNCDDENMAKQVCDMLGIEHIIVDRRELFQKSVIEDFVNAYEKGLTPNPCVLCNKTIKFSEMLKIADSVGAEYVATGHYSRVEYHKRSGRYVLLRPNDKTKDQTYMLYKLTQNQLSRTLMPLADYTKEEVREIARKIGLSVADRPDSQDICFVPDGDYAAFIKNYTNKAFPQGDYVSVDGKILGKHKGMIHYTVGQRKGLGIALGKPAFVVEKQADLNRVVLSDNEELLFKKTVKITDINFIPFEKLDGTLNVTAKLRYRHKDSPATVRMTGEKEAVIEFASPQRAPAPGQSAVLYDGDIVIGGGIIV